MNFDLNQLLQGPVRDLVLNQVTKQFGVSSETGGNLLNKGLSMVFGGMTQKASSVEGAKGLFDLIKNSPFQGNPLDLITGKAELNGGDLLEVGKNVLPSLFGDKADAITQHLADSTNTTPVAAKGVFGMLLPVVFSVFKNKILGGMGLGGFANLLGEQAKSFSSNLDSKSLSVLGFSAGSFGDVLGNFGKVSQSLGNLGSVGAGVAATATAATAAVKSAATQKVAAVEETAKSSGLGKWLLAGGVLLAALFGIKTCSDNKADMTAASAAQPTAQTEQAPAAPAVEEVKTTDGLGDLSWNKTDKDFTLSGTVQNDGIKSSLLDAFKGLAGDLPLVDKLTVDAKSPQFGFNNFAGLTGLLKEFPNVSGSFADKALNLAGSVASEEAKSGLMDKAKALLGSAFSINADNVSVDAPVTQLVDGLGNLAWSKGENDFAVSGTVQNEGVKSSILDAFKGLAGNLPLVDKLVVDANAPQFNFGNFAGLADVLKAFPGVNGSFADKALNLVGQVAAPEMKTALVEKTQAFLGNIFSVNADGVTVVEQAKETVQAEPAALADMSAAKLDLDIVFNTGSSEIDARYYNRLNAFAKFLIENNRRGEIAGYTDNVGNAEANQKLSEKRANAVREYLVKQGVAADALVAVGYGQENPIADNSTKEGRDKNRRIEFNAR